MHFANLVVLLLSIAGSHGAAQYHQFPNPYFFRSGFPVSSSLQRPQDGRFFFAGLLSTYTLTIATMTTTSTITATTTCTTSAAALSTCTTAAAAATGRRRRFAQELLFNNHEEEREDGSISVKSPEIEPLVQSENAEAVRDTRGLDMPASNGPVSIQPSGAFGAIYTPEIAIDVPAPVSLSRIFIAFGTATVTSTTTTTTTATLTAICSSTTSYSTCSSSG